MGGVKSDLWRKGGNYKACNDAPSMDFGIRDLDGDTLPQMVNAVMPFQKRNYVAMEVRKNLLSEERQKVPSRFDPETFKRVAVVIMGEPPAEFKAKVHAAMLVEKKRK